MYEGWPDENKLAKSLMHLIGLCSEHEDIDVTGVFHLLVNWMGVYALLGVSALGHFAALRSK